MKITPDHTDLQKHIEYFWIVKDVASLFSTTNVIYDFLGTSPEHVLVLDDQLEHSYQGRIINN